MKKFSLVALSVFFIAIGVATETTGKEKAVFKINTEKSTVNWTGKKVTGQHTGTLKLDNGEVSVDGEKISMANVKMDMNSIVCLDLTNPETNKKLVGHLKSDDFFSVEKFPHSEFVATGFKAGSGKEDYMVTGKLTIKGITHEISFPATVKIVNGQMTANGTAKIDRTKYDIKYGSGSFFKGLGDNMIYDDFEIEFNLVATAEAI
jgi:polyisoprenoid-binding protein YceI